MTRPTGVILTRHGETTHNRDGILQGGIDTELTEQGITQAENLARRFADEDLAALYTSPLTRAKRTAEILGDRIGQEPTELKGLGEQRLGVWEGDARGTLFDELAARDEKWVEWEPEGGESWSGFADRVLTTLRPVLQEHDGETILVVGHSKVNKAIISKAKFGSIAHEAQIDQDNTCVNRLRYYSDGTWECVDINETSHLSTRA